MTVGVGDEQDVVGRQKTSEVVLALDLGGTKVEAALVDTDGTIQAGSRCRRGTGVTARIEDLRHATNAVIDSALGALSPGMELIGAGIGSAGPLSLEDGTVTPFNLPGAERFALRDLVQWRVPGLNVRMRLDGTCIAVAENWVGATRGHTNSMAMIVSTGVGCGIIVDGRVVSGDSGNAGHAGQIHVADSDSRNAETGTLESIASGPHTVLWARARGWTGSSGEELAQAYQSGNPIARAAVDRSAHAVGRAIADVSTLLDLSIVAIGGGFSRVADDYVDKVRRAHRESAVLGYARRTQVVTSGLDDRGPLIGAAGLVLWDEVFGGRVWTDSVARH